MRGMWTSVSTRSTVDCTRQVERLNAVAGLHHLVPGALQGEQHHLTHRCRIVDRKNFLDHETVSAAKPVIYRPRTNCSNIANLAGIFTNAVTKRAPRPAVSDRSVAPPPRTAQHFRRRSPGLTTISSNTG